MFHLYHWKTSQERVDTAVAQHAIWLKTRGCKGKRLNFSAHDLDGIDFSGADLRKAKFRRAELSGANFADTLLGAANLRGSLMFATETGGAHIEDAKTLGAFMLLKESPVRPTPRFGADGRLQHLVARPPLHNPIVAA
jgi:hypothetical protein